jgi:hypothetical protein
MALKKSPGQGMKFGWWQAIIMASQAFSSIRIAPGAKRIAKSDGNLEYFRELLNAYCQLLAARLSRACRGAAP